MAQETTIDSAAIREEVERDFPDDPMMQELHAIRLARYYALRDLPIREQIRGYLPRHGKEGTPVVGDADPVRE
jgi:hypothetical protein